MQTIPLPFEDLEVVEALLIEAGGVNMLRSAILIVMKSLN
jgi:hypothetical protein